MIKHGNEAKNSLCKGIDKLANSVKVTLGPSGRNVLIANNGNPFLTKDGVTVAKHVVITDPYEKLGAKILKDVALKTCEDAGDGTSSSIVLAQAMIQEGLKLITDKVNPVLVKEGIDFSVESIVEQLKNNARQVEDKQTLINIATISANNDDTIGNIIGDALEMVNNKGIVQVVMSKTSETRLEKVEGVQFETGFESPYFINNKTKHTVEYDEPRFLIFKKKLDRLDTLVKELSKAQKENQPVVILAPSIESNVLQQIIANYMNGAVEMVFAKIPGYGDTQKEQLEDIVNVIGTDNKGEFIIGYAEHVELSKTTMSIVQGKSNPLALAQHLNNLKLRLEDDNAPATQLRLTERIAKLEGGAAIIHVGGNSELEVKEKKDRIDDALCATRAALEEGYIIGGGYALLECVPAQRILWKEDQLIGRDIVNKATFAIQEQILLNAGINKGDIETDTGIQYNPRTRTYENFYETGIIDPVKVVRTSLENAASIAGAFLTTECVLLSEEITE